MISSKSLRSLETKHTWFHILIVLAILMILSVGIRRDVYEFVNSGLGRVLMIVAIYGVIRSYGVIAGILSAVAVVAVLMSPSREGMETKDDDSKKDDSKDDTDDEKDDTDDDSKNDDTDTDTEDDEDDDDIETKTANDNQQGTQSQLDMDRGMKMASHKNSQNQEETVEQMKKEKQKEGFSNMMGVGDMFKSTPCAV